jgi:uncharacterized protein YutE (UPF0331/DUF86 family)
MTETCGATNRNGEPCGLPAGWGTDHVGEGRCKLHGGQSPTGEDNPAFKHGLFSDHLDERDRQTVTALEDFDDAQKLEELVNWRLARLRRALRQLNQEEARSFWDAFESVVDGADTIEAAEMRELAKMLDQNNRAMQEEIDLVRRLIRDRNKIAEGEDVNVSGWVEALGGGDG